MLNCRQEHIHVKAECVPTPVAPLREALLTFLEEAQGRTVCHINLAPPSCPLAICTVTVMTTLLRQLSPSRQFTIHHLSLVQDSYVCFGTFEPAGCPLSPAAAEEEGAQVADKGLG